MRVVIRAWSVQSARGLLRCFPPFSRVGQRWWISTRQRNDATSEKKEAGMMGTLECFMKHGIVHGLCVGRGDAEGSDPCKPTTVISCFGSVYTRHATRGCGFDDVVACARFDLCAEGRQTTASEERRRTSWERKSGGREVAVCLRVDGGRISKPDGACSASRLFARRGRGVRPARCLPAEVFF
jgi:hypothetical protein